MMIAVNVLILYIGMAMIIGAFICFMLLGRNTSDYLTVDTLMLGACGIFDLFWWSILGETDIVRQTKTLDPLTVREQEVLQLILSGKSNREIARALFISESTVKTHARNIFSKYDVGSRAELISTLLKNQTIE